MKKKHIRFKDVLNSAIYCKTLKKILCISNKEKSQINIVLMYKIVVLTVLYNQSEIKLLNEQKLPLLNGF